MALNLYEDLTGANLTSEKHIPALDGIRGLAVLIVVAYHTGGGSQATNPIIRSIGITLKTGWSGVTLFFVLSGFLISGILWDTRDTPHWLKNFYIRRTLRIFPLYYGSLLLVLATAYLAHQGYFSLSRLWVYAFYLQNVPLLKQFASNYGSPLWLSHFWSLAVEEQFYLIWPFILMRMKSLNEAKRLCLATILVSFCFRFVIWKYYPEPPAFNGFLLSRAGELAAGGYLAMSYRDGTWHVLNRFAAPVALGSLAGFIGLCWLQGSAVFEGNLVAIYALVCLTVLWSSVLVLSLRQGGLWNRAMNVGMLRWVGGISYGLYIFHVLLTPLYGWITGRILPHAGRVTGIAVDGVLTVCISFPLAWLSFHYFESPFLRLRKRFSRTHSIESKSAGQMVR